MYCSTVLALEALLQVDSCFQWKEGIVFTSRLEVTLGNKRTVSSSPSSTEGVEMEEKGWECLLSVWEKLCSKENWKNEEI